MLQITEIYAIDVSRPREIRDDIIVSPKKYVVFIAVGSRSL